MIDIFTDGSTTNNCRLSKKARGGVGVYFPSGNYTDIAEPFYIFPITNQRCELYACIRAVQEIIMKIKKKKVKVQIITDSQYVIKSMTKWIHMWIKRGWKKANGVEPLNMDLIYWLYNLTEQHKDKFEITYKHIKAHREEPQNRKSNEYYLWKGNDNADRLSKKGRKINCS